MFGVIATAFTGAIHFLSTTLSLAAVGAMFGAGVWLVSRLVPNWIYGIAISAAAGAVLAVGVSWTGLIADAASDAAQQKIAALESENAALKQELAAKKALADKLAGDLAAQRDADAHNQEILAELKAALDAQADNPDCVISKETMDLLNQME